MSGFVGGAGRPRKRWRMTCEVYRPGERFVTEIDLGDTWCVLPETAMKRAWREAEARGFNCRSAAVRIQPEVMS